MKNFLYSILGIVLGITLCTTFLTNISNKGYDTNEAAIESPEINNQENNYVTNESIKKYHIDNDDLAKYTSDKVIVYGKSNPMLYLEQKKVEPKDDSQDSTTNNESNTNSDNSEEDNQNQNDDNESSSWKDYDGDYIVSDNVLLGYNSDAGTLSKVEVKDILDDVLANNVFPYDKSFYHITSKFGKRLDPFGTKVTQFHSGLDMAKEGILKQNAYSVTDGTVTIGPSGTGYGNYITITNDIYQVKYAHLDSISADLKNGQSITAGTLIGQIGNTGKTTGPHLHMEFIKNGLRLNPKYFLDKLYNQLSEEGN